MTTSLYLFLFRQSDPSSYLAASLIPLVFAVCLWKSLCPSAPAQETSSKHHRTLSPIIRQLQAVELSAYGPPALYKAGTQWNQGCLTFSAFLRALREIAVIDPLFLCLRIWLWKSFRTALDWLCCCLRDIFLGQVKVKLLKICS